MLTCSHPMCEMFNNIFKTFFNSVFLHLPVHSAVKRNFFLTLKEKKTKTPHQKQTLKRALQICNIDKAVSVLFGKVVNPCTIAYILREVTNPYAISDVLSITQTGQTSEYTVEEYGMFMQK